MRRFGRREVNLLAGEQKTASYKAIHPLGRVPSLDDDGVVVRESGAILLYLADKFPEARLMLSCASAATATRPWLRRAASARLTSLASTSMPTWLYRRATAPASSTSDATCFGPPVAQDALKLTGERRSSLP